VSRLIDANAAPLSFFTYVPALVALAHSVQLSAALALSWSVVDGTLTARLSYAGSNGPTWFLFGLTTPAGSIAGSDVVVFEPGRAAAGSDNDGVNQYVIAGQSAAGLVAVPLASQQLYAVSVSRGAGGVATVQLSRSRAAGSYAGAQAIPASGPVAVVFAVGPAGQGLLAGPPSLTDAGSGLLDLSTGAFTAASSTAGSVSRSTLVVGAHGVIMFCAWGVLAPAGALVARYARHWKDHSTNRSPVWHATHRTLQTTALFMSVCGLALAVVLVAPTPGQHFSGAHHVLGLIVVLLGLLQPSLALCSKQPRARAAGVARSSKRHETVWSVAHSIIGYATLCLAAAAVFLGLQAAGAPPALLAVYAVLLAVGIASVLWKELSQRRRKHSAARKTVAGHAWEMAAPLSRSFPRSLASESAGCGRAASGGVEMFNPVGTGLRTAPTGALV
jgi:hypothetical protein